MKFVFEISRVRSFTSKTDERFDLSADASPSPSLSAAARLPDAAGLRPHAQRRDRQQGHQVQAPGGGVHLGALAGEDLQGQAPGQPGAAGPQAAQRGAQAEVHVQKGESSITVSSKERLRSTSAAAPLWIEQFQNS